MFPCSGTETRGLRHVPAPRASSPGCGRRRVERQGLGLEEDSHRRAPRPRVALDSLFPLIPTRIFNILRCPQSFSHFHLRFHRALGPGT